MPSSSSWVLPRSARLCKTPQSKSSVTSPLSHAIATRVNPVNPLYYTEYRPDNLIQTTTKSSASRGIALLGESGWTKLVHKLWCWCSVAPGYSGCPCPAAYKLPWLLARATYLRFILISVKIKDIGRNSLPGKWTWSSFGRGPSNSSA